MTPRIGAGPTGLFNPPNPMTGTTQPKGNR